MLSQPVRCSRASPRVFSALLLHALSLSEMAWACPDTTTSADLPPSPILRRATTSGLSTVTVTAAASGKKELSLPVIIVIIVASVVAFLVICGLLWFWYRKHSKSTKTKPLNLPTIGQRSSRLLSGSTRHEPDWWQPPVEAETVHSHDHTIVPYSQGGHGYTYGRTPDVSSLGVAGTRSSVGHFPQAVGAHGTRGSVAQFPPFAEQEPGRPFQIPVLATAPPPTPSSIGSYHIYTGGQSERPLPPPKDSNAIPQGQVYNPVAYTAQTYNPPRNPVPINPPPDAFQQRPVEANPGYLQSQATGTSIYSSPYETSAMTRSTSGHP